MLGRDLKIGDIVPLPEGVTIDRAALGYLKARKTRAATMMAKVAGKAATNQLIARARIVEAGNAETVQRLADPYEQAATFLRRKGYTVYAKSVLKPPRKGIVVGRLTMPDRKAVMAYAASLGFTVRKK